MEQENKEKKRAVMVYFTPAELEAIKMDTGVEADATAVTAFVRRRIRSGQA